MSGPKEPSQQRPEGKGSLESGPTGFTARSHRAIRRLRLGSGHVGMDLHLPTSGTIAAMRLRVVCAFALLMALLWFVPIQSGSADQVRKITLFYTGFVHGNYGPCG